MHYPDLEICSYGRGANSPEEWRVPLLAIGWLEGGFEFATGEPIDGLIERVIRFQEETRDRFSAYIYRGQHTCSICGPNTESIERSHINLFIPGIDCVYMASGGLAHYLEFHSYTPPGDFVSALLSCPFPSSKEYEDALIAANCGIRPELLMSFEELYPELSKLKSEQASSSNGGNALV
jgi:hypothetical protein